MRSILDDLRYALRTLGRRPGFTAVAALTLALGIGATTAIFGLIHAVLLRPLPYRDSDRLVMVWTTERSVPEEGLAVPPGVFLDWRRRSRSFEALAASRFWQFTLSGGEHPEQIEGAVVTANLFALLGVRPELGHAFDPAEDGSGERAVVLGHGLWKRRFGADPAIVGRRIVLNGEPFEVRGVAPVGFEYYVGAELWVLPRRRVPESPLDPTGLNSEARGNGYLAVVARLRPGVTLPVAQGEMDAISRVLAREHPDTEAQSRVKLVPLREQLLGDVRPRLWLLFAAVGLVLLIACANVAGLLASRALSRGPEISVRQSLGAGRSRLVRQLLTESAALGALGGGVGLLLALGASSLLALLVPAGLPDLPAHGPNVLVLVFTAGVSLGTAFLSGLLPAVQASRSSPAAVLRAAGTAAGGRNRQAGNLLVVGEVALSVLLATATILLFKSLSRLEEVDPGFDARDVLAAGVTLPASRYDGPARKEAFFGEVLERLASTPGVAGAGAVSRLPLRPGNSTRTVRPPERPEARVDADYRVASPGYFRTMGIPLVAGRELKASDIEGQPTVVVVNRTLAHRLWPGGSPIGQRVQIEDRDLEVVGVVGDVRHLALDVAPRPEVYAPYAQDPWPFMTLVVRARTDPAALAPAVRRAVESVDPDQPLSDVQTLAGIRDDSLEGRRMFGRAMGLFAATALVMALVGLYGVLSQIASRRTMEMGVRMALGARRADVLAVVLGHAVLLTVVGLAAGLALAVGLGGLVASQLYGVGARDPSTLLGVAAAVGCAALAASAVPAFRAASTDPLLALKQA